MFRRATLSITAACIVACSIVEPIPVHVPSDYGVGLSAATFSPNGRLAAVANFNTIWILDVGSMKKLMSFSGHYRFGTNNTLAFVNNDLIASTGKTDSDRLGKQNHQAAVRIWDIRDQYSDPIVIALPELGEYSISLAHSDVTGALAVGGYNGAIALLEPNNSASYDIKHLPRLQGPVLDVIFSRDGGMLAAAGVHPTVPIWDTESLIEIGALPVNGNVYDLDLIPGKSNLLVAGDELRVWKFLSKGDLEAAGNPTLAGDYITVGAMVAMYSVLALLGVAPYVPTAPSHEPDYGQCTRVTEVSPTGELLVDVHSGITKEKIRIIEFEGAKVVRTLNPRGGGTCGLAFNRSGSKLLITNNRVARLYDTANWDYEDFELR